MCVPSPVHEEEPEDATADKGLAGQELRSRLLHCVWFSPLDDLTRGRKGFCLKTDIYNYKFIIHLGRNVLFMTQTRK